LFVCKLKYTDGSSTIFPSSSALLLFPNVEVSAMCSILLLVLLLPLVASRHTGTKH